MRRGARVKHLTLRCPAFPQRYPGLPPALYMSPGLQPQGQDKHTRICKAPYWEDVTGTVSSEGMLLLSTSMDIMGTTILPGSVSVKIALRTQIICGHRAAAVFPPSSLASQPGMPTLLLWGSTLAHSDTCRQAETDKTTSQG